MTYDMRHLFICLLAICMSFLVRLLRSLAHFLNGLFFLNFKSFWYILDNSSLSHVFHKYFLPVSGLSSCSFGNVIPEQKSSSWTVLPFTDHAFAVVSKMSSPYLRSAGFSPIVFSRVFIFFCFALRSAFHFELTFVKGVICVSRFILCVWVSSSGTIIWKDCLGPTALPVSLSKKRWVFM